jgi:aminopeptidase N
MDGRSSKMTFLLVAMAAFCGALIAELVFQVLGKRGQRQIMEEASRMAVAEVLVQVRSAQERLEQSVSRLEQSGVRIEAANAVVAEDLSASCDRADAVQGDAGEAADAASRSPEKC